MGVVGTRTGGEIILSFSLEFERNEAYDFSQVFEELLLDADWALNAGNWMWLSASAFFHQYFRVYSPIAFGKKTDKHGDYIKWTKQTFSSINQWKSFFGFSKYWTIESICQFWRNIPPNIFMNLGKPRWVYKMQPDASLVTIFVTDSCLLVFIQWFVFVFLVKCREGLSETDCRPWHCYEREFTENETGLSRQRRR